MTLILAAICKDGICVCADKKNLRRYDDGRIVKSDDRNKVCKFCDDILIYNHGVNEFNNMSWEVLCSNFKNSDKWRNKCLFDVACEFKNFATDRIKEQLAEHYNCGRKDSTCTGFVFLGKTAYDTNFKIYELWWKYNSSMNPYPDPHEGLVRSGYDESKSILQDILNCNPNLLKTKYWKNLNCTQTKNKLNEIFLAAYEKQGRKKYFSKKRKIICIPDLEDN